MVSSKGDFIGQGKTWILTQPQASLAAEHHGDDGESSVEVTATGSGGQWDLQFGLADGKPWAPGLYEDASRYRPFQDRPGLSVSGQNRGCNQVRGRFEILELVYQGPSVERLAINFEQRCVEGSGGLLSGIVRFDSTIGR